MPEFYHARFEFVLPNCVEESVSHFAYLEGVIMRACSAYKASAELCIFLFEEDFINSHTS